ncbi:hypothetical protein [Hymenobacter algoricola]|uniref:Uncharacterized protein n=1 Tax=Hymenobacter algoricola TaxID=486267 RepID=A0ABP7MFH9_9BACT
MSPTPGVPEPEPEVPKEPAGLLPAAELSTEEICLTEIDKSIADIIALTDTAQEVGLEPDLAVVRKRGRPARSTVSPSTWSIRGVTRDTRNLLEQAARQVGKTLGQYLNEDIRFCVEQHRLIPPPNTMATLQKQVQYLRQMVESLTVMVRASHGQPPLPDQ